MSTYSPKWCPHVTAEITEDEIDSKRVHRLVMRCAICGEERPGVCPSGNPRGTVGKFALLHLHRNPLDPGRPDVPEQG